MAAGPAILRRRKGGRRRGRRAGLHGGAVAQRRGGDHGGTGDPRSLEDLILGTVAELERDGSADCPVCGAAELRPYGCGACGSELR